jgi:hypothetical protein
MGMIINFQSIQIYIIDTFGMYSASGAFFTAHLSGGKSSFDCMILQRSRQRRSSVVWQDLASRYLHPRCMMGSVMALETRSWL